MRLHHLLFGYTALVFLCDGSSFTNASYYNVFIKAKTEVCLQTPCFTLSQFAAVSEELNINDSLASLSIFFLPGTHFLDREISFTNKDSISISKGNNTGNVTISCSSEFGRFAINNISTVSLQGLQFTNCSGNKLTLVEQLIVEDVVFQYVTFGMLALELNNVVNASIIRSTFFNLTLGVNYYYGYLSFNFSVSDILDFVYLERNASLTSSSAAVLMANSNVLIINSTFLLNMADIGGAILAHRSNLSIISSTFTSNVATFGGVMVTSESTVDIANSIFTTCTAATGGVIMAYNDLYTIRGSIFSNNYATKDGGVMAMYRSYSVINGSIFEENRANISCGALCLTNSSITVIHTNATRNSAGSGGVMSVNGTCSFNITSSTFTNNSGVYACGVIATAEDTRGSYDITNSTFTHNNAHSGFGGVLCMPAQISFSITSSTFSYNSVQPGGFGGVIIIGQNLLESNMSVTNPETSLIILNSLFKDNSAGFGGVIFATNFNHISVISSTFTNNSATNLSSVIVFVAGSLNIYNSVFINNHFADDALAVIEVILLQYCSAHISNITLSQNSGSLYIFNSGVSLSGNIISENRGTQELDTARNEVRLGGAVTLVQSFMNFTGVNILTNNQASHGGAILATESTIEMYNEIIIANNSALNGRGGGMSLEQSVLDVHGRCKISGNSATNGGGIHISSSTANMYLTGSVEVVSNHAALNGGGIYLEVNPKINFRSQQLLQNRYNGEPKILLNLRGNNADNYGGGLYVVDRNSARACSTDFECFVKQLIIIIGATVNNFPTINFSENYAQEGSNIYGGLLDRCIPNHFLSEFQQYNLSNGITYLESISNIEPSTIASQAVRVYFCDNKKRPRIDDSYQPPTIKVRKGERFTVSLVAVDQVNNTVATNIVSSLTSREGGLGEGQQTQPVGEQCTDLTFNVFSPFDIETLSLYADGPCGNAALSTSYLTLEFLNCTCPIGFEPHSTSQSESTCQCDCDPSLSAHISSCNSTTGSLVRSNSNSWITYTNYTDPPGYVIFANCPFDYCHRPTNKVSFNLNLADGADALCTNNRRGVICGTCEQNYSLSLGSSRCLSCKSYWPAILVVILLASFIAGILLVTAILVLNMTVAVGLINSFIFYGNIVAAGGSVFFPTSQPSFPSIFVAWLNLDVGVDTCFFDGFNAYTKTWLQLAFPVYIISLVIIVIIVSECSPRFAELIGRRDPIATLATLILLSYAKLLSVTITALSFAVLDYPDGSRQTVWLLDGSVMYFKGKHVPLALMALLIILIGLPYTITLFLWQWIVRAPSWRGLRWTRHSKLNAFITAYHVPYNRKYRYWTGLLLLVRVVLYITSAVTVSANPQTIALLTSILVGGLLVFQVFGSIRLYNNSLVNVIDTVVYCNLLALAMFTLYDFNVDITKQTAVIYVSTLVTFLSLIGVIAYHVLLLIKKKKEGTKEKLLDHDQAAPNAPAVTHTAIELVRHQELEDDDDEIEHHRKPLFIPSCGVQYGKWEPESQ